MSLFKNSFEEYNHKLSEAILHINWYNCTIWTWVLVNFWWHSWDWPHMATMGLDNNKM